MNKAEFLSILRGRITGRIPTSEVEAQIDYYSAYIDGRIGAGLTEEEAVGELGDPLLIAKTVVESTDRAAEAAGYDGPYQRSSDTYADSDGINTGIFGESGPNSYQQQGRYYEQDNYYQQGNYQQQGNSYQQSNYTQNDYTRAAGTGQQQGGQKSSSGMGSSLCCIIAVVVLVLIMALFWVLTIFVFRVSFRLLGWLFPVIAVVGIVALIIRLFRGR